MTIAFGDDDWAEFFRGLSEAGVFREIDALTAAMREALSTVIIPSLDTWTRAFSEAMPLIDYSELMKPFVDSFEPIRVVLAENQASWMPNLTSAMSAFAASVSAIHVPPLQLDPPAREVDSRLVAGTEEPKELVTRRALRPLSPAEMRRVLAAAAKVLGGLWFTTEVVAYFAGDGASPAEVLMWSAALLFGMTFLIVSAVDFDRDDE